MTNRPTARKATSEAPVKAKPATKPKAKPAAPKSNQVISEVLYGDIVEAFNHFNQSLFSGELPANIVFTLNRKPRSAGYFWADKFQNADGSTAHEISLHADLLRTRDTITNLSTFAHEMVHLWQEVDGTKNPKNAYHNREWADMMKEIGLHPSTTGQPGGKETGKSCSHYIIEGGPFEKAALELIEMGYAFKWGSIPAAPSTPKTSKRVKYECSMCGAAVWGKEGLSIECQPCEEKMEQVKK